MRLDLRFSYRPLEDLWCQAVGAFVFQRPDIITGVLADLDKKMAGHLANLSGSGLWTGERSEKFLLATQDIIRADKLLLHGLGPKTEFTTKILDEETTGLGAAFERLGVNDLGIHIPVPEGLETDYASLLEISARNLVDTFHGNHKDDPGFLLKLIFSVEIDYMDILTPLVNRLRRHFDPILDFSIIVDSKKAAESTEVGGENHKNR